MKKIVKMERKPLHVTQEKEGRYMLLCKNIIIF